MQSDGMTSTTEFSAEEFELLAYLLEEEGTIDDRQVIPRRDPQAEIPLSFAQERLWFLDQWEPGNPAYNLLFAARVKGDLQVAAFERSLNEILQRHEALRTTFQVVDGQPRQIIAPALNLPLSMIDLSSLPHDEQHGALQQHIARHSQQRFDLATGPLLRMDLLRLSPHEHLFLLTIHHIIFDGWSIGVFLRELTLLYEAFVKDQPVPLHELPIQYADFAIWQRAWLQGDVLQQQLSYWQRQLDGSLPVLELPTDYPRPPVMTHEGSFREQLFPAALSRRLHALSQTEGATLFMTLLAAFYVLLFRYTGQTDLLVGSPIANRAFVDLEPLVGFFLNTLVLRADLSGNGSFRGLLHQVRETTLEAYAHQNVPFEQLVEELRPPRDRAHTPIFQVMFILQNMPIADHGQRELEVAFERVDKGAAKFDLTLSLNDTIEGLRVMAEYKTDLFAATTIDRLLGHYQTLLEAIAVDLDQPIAALPLLTATERQQILAWNETPRPPTEHVCIHQLFEVQAARTPDATALVHEGAQLSYRELNERANQLAHHLLARGVRPEERIGLCLARSVELIVGVLGVLKAGCAYVPLDPNYPSERLQFMVADAQVNLLLTHQATPADAVTPWFAGAVVDLLADAEPIRRQPTTNPEA
ncbi:MAG TPA: condensation domain-containing protein, partial [Herpetosiphonaceae bacterium]